MKFHDKMTKLKLKTFDDLSKKMKGSSKGVIIKAGRALFAQMIITAENRKLKMSDVLCHPLGPLPWSLPSADGSLRKTNKVSLAKEVQKDMTAADMIPQPCARIMDGMSMVQKIRGDQKTFAEVADNFIYMVLNEGTDSQRFDVAFDINRDNSIKNPERERREAQKTAMNSETSRQITRYISFGNFFLKLINNSSSYKPIRIRQIG